MPPRVPSKTQSFLRNVSVEALSDSEVVAIPAGAAAVLVNFSISKHPVTNAGGTDIGGAGDTSLAITVGDALDTEVGKKDDADLANGEFYVDYLTGRGRGRKATTGTSITFTFKLFKMMVSGVTLVTGDLEIGAVEIKNATDDTRATVGANGLYVDVRTSALPTGASTSANQSTTNTALAAIQTAVELLDNIVSGSEAQVDIVAPLPAGTNNIGDVDVLSLPAGNLGQQAMAASLSTVPASNITDATYIGDIKFGESLPAGSSNIGDVDIASLPAGNLGQQAMAASLSTVPANNITDATYIGDIKFGEALPAGTNNIGDVDVLSLPALPAGTNLIGNVGNGKTIKSVTGSASATFTIVAAVPSKKIRVFSLSLITASTTAVTITFKDGAAGTAKGTYLMQALANTNFGITENVTIPGFLFETSAGVLLEMAFSGAQTVVYNLRYWDDD